MQNSGAGVENLSGIKVPLRQRHIQTQWNGLA